MVALDRTYAYAGPSSLSPRAGGQSLALVSERPPEEAVPARFLAARALAPMATARGLRAVSEIVGSRFYVPPAMLTRILREADPVATVSPGAVRFEGFSACCSAYARLDMGDGALEASERRNGTTNVDFGADLRGALAAVGRDTALDISIGPEEVGIARDGREIVEKKVPLPVRWIKGFAEVQVVMAGMAPAFALPRVAAQRFLRALPRSRADQLQRVSVAGGQARLAARESPGAVPLCGPHRLRVLEPLMALGDALEVHLNRETGASAWVVTLGAQRLTLVLNREPWRGFSGDGGLLSRLVARDGGAVAARRAQRAGQDRLGAGGGAAAPRLAAEAVDGALAHLAASGLVGFDLAGGGYFHRVLPFDMERIAALNPRLRAAEALVEAGAVTLLGSDAEVASEGAVHRVRAEGGEWRCTCPWYAQNGAGRGPCKHVLAVAMQSGAT